MASVYRIPLIESTALVASVNGTTKTLEAFSGDFIGYLRCSANDGATTVNAKIQQSADGTNWIDVVSFTALVNVTGFERKLITEALLPHIRGVITLTSGGTPSATVEMAFYHDKKR